MPGSDDVGAAGAGARLTYHDLRALPEDLTLGGDERLTSPLFPGFALRLTDLFADD
jgi:hypothetical protein